MSNRLANIPDFLSSILRVRNEWAKEYRAKRQVLGEWGAWFRGEPATYPTALLPKLYRSIGAQKKKDVLHAEQELRLEFRRKGIHVILGTPPTSKWDWYFLLAHHGEPARLLDWSDGALVALYFAIKPGPLSDEEHRTDPVVYMLDPWWLNDRVFAANAAKNHRSEGVALPDWYEAEDYLPDELDSEDLAPRLPLAIDPLHLSTRIAAQRSRFVILGRKPKVLAALLEDKSAKIKKFVIDRAATQAMLGDLEASGISESTIFPDLDGLGRELDLTCSPKYLK